MSLSIGVYTSNNGNRRIHLGDTDQWSEGLRPSLCGLHFLVWSPVRVIEDDNTVQSPATRGKRSRDADVEEVLRYYQEYKKAPHCQRCLRLAQRFRDAVSQLGAIAPRSGGA